MKTDTQYLTRLAKSHADAFARGEMSLMDLSNWVLSFEGSLARLLSTFYTLELVSHLPDSAEKEIRLYLKQIIDRNQ